MSESRAFCIHSWRCNDHIGKSMTGRSAEVCIQYVGWDDSVERTISAVLFVCGIRRSVSAVGDGEGRAVTESSGEAA